MDAIPDRPFSLSEIIQNLHQFWVQHGCMILQPFDMEISAGTLHPNTFLRAIGPEPWCVAYVQPSRRPSDGRYGNDLCTTQYFHQYQVVLKPAPHSIQELCIDSLRAIGIHPLQNDIRLVEHNYAYPALDTWGLGWEVWLNGMECIQFTYYQQVGGLRCTPVMVELAYNLEHLALHIQSKASIFDLLWAKTLNGSWTYGDVFHQNEVEMSFYNFEQANVRMLLTHFDDFEKECQKLTHENAPLPAYEMLLNALHTFNILEARNAITLTNRQRYVLRMRALARDIATTYYTIREQLGFPCLHKANENMHGM